MYKGRLFTFGCSFTKYIWPTWADLLGLEFEQHYNYGKTGGGNLFIACSVAEAVATHNITSDDTVLIMWTNVTREDRYINNRWFTPGNIFTNQRDYSEDFIKNMVSIRGCYVRDMAQIFLTDNLLQKIGCRYEFMSIVDVDNSDQYDQKNSSDEVQDVLNLYKLSIDKFKPSFHKIVFNYDWRNNKPIYDINNNKLIERFDLHPLPIEHIEYINLVLPEYKFSDKTTEIAKDIDTKIRMIYREGASMKNPRQWVSSTLRENWNVWNIDNKSVRL